MAETKKSFYSSITWRTTSCLQKHGQLVCVATSLTSLSQRLSLLMNPQEKLRPPELLLPYPGW